MPYKQSFVNQQISVDLKALLSMQCEEALLHRWYSPEQKLKHQYSAFKGHAETRVF